MRAAVAAACVLACAQQACDRPSPVRAFQAKERTELIGGPAAIGEERDFVLENDRIRLVVSAVGNSTGPGLFGGSIVDVDVRRTDVRFANGKGLDHFSEVFPMTNLIVPGFFDGRGNVGLDDMQITVVNDGRDREAAILRIVAKGDAIIEALTAVGLVGVTTDMSFATELVLAPHQSFVTMRTRVNIDSKRTPRPEDDPATDTPMTPIRGTQPLFEALLGDALLDEDEQVLQPGFLAGDFLLFGPKVSVFAPDGGYGVALEFQERFDAGEDLLNDPFTTPWIAATGDRVSYAYFSAGDLSIPIFTSSFTGAFTHVYQCEVGDETCESGYTEGRLVYERYLAVGQGDVASALEPYWSLRGEPHGRVHGHVLDGPTGRPVSGADVLVLRAPERAVATAEEAVAANRAETGRPGVMLQMKSDAAADARPEGAFQGTLPPGDYLLVARKLGHPRSSPVPFRITDGASVELVVPLPLPGRLNVSVTDERGAAAPGKLTLLGPGPCDLDAPLAGAPAARSSLQEAAFGDSELPDGTLGIRYLAPGAQIVEVPAGTYQALVSRGVEYSLHRECLTVEPGRDVLLRATVAHVVDTTGWISADFHIHGMFSYDAWPTHRQRVGSAIGEGLELACSTDHDYLSDLGPTAAEMGVSDYLATMVGLETTTIETGHYIGFPLRFDETAAENGAIDWSRRDQCVRDPSSHGCLFGDDEIVLPLVPDEIFDALRGLGSLGPDGTVVTVPHPRDGFFGYFDQFGLDPFDLSVEPGGVSSFNPVLLSELFSGRFDAIELANGKRFEMIRTPTIAEIVEFQERLEPLRDAGGSAEEIAALHEELAERVLARTAAESEALQMATPQPERGGPCTEHADCRADEKCSARGECEGLDCSPEEAGDPLLAERACLIHQGVVDDWFRLLDHGVRATGLANSDTHKLFDTEVGMPRNWVASVTDAPGEVRGDDVAAAVRQGRVTVGLGPFVELWVDGAPIGSTITASGTLAVRVRVQTPEWFGVDRVEVYRNGVLWVERDLEVDATEIVDFDETLEDDPDGDAWYVAIALGRSSSLSPIYTSVPHPQLGFSQVAAVAFGGIEDELIQSIIPPVPAAPEITPVLPYGITNPVWVDVDGGGFAAPLPTPGWVSGGSSEIPLTRARLDDPFGLPDLPADEARARRLDLLRRWIARAVHLGH
jgi:hypothetical protein